MYICVLDTTLFDKFVSDLQQVGGLILHIQKCTSVSTSNKTDSHDIIEILLNVALNTIILTL